MNRYSINRTAINAIAVAAATIGHAAVFSASGDFTASGTRSNARQGTAQIAASGGFTASGKKVASNAKTVTGPGSGAINSSSVNSRAINGSSPGGSSVVPIPFVFSASGGFTASGKKGINATAKFYDSAYSIAAGEKTAFSNRSIASVVGGSGAINGRAINASAINGAAGSVTSFTPVPIIFAASGGFGASGGSSANPGHSAVFAGSGDFQAAGKQPKEFANFWASGGFRASGFKSAQGSTLDKAQGDLVAHGRRGERIPISVAIHVGPLITFRVHVSPVGEKSMEDYLAIGSTNVVRATKMRNDLTGEPITDAVATGTLYDSDGNPVTGAVDFSMQSIAGEYRGTIASTVALVPAPYNVRVTASNADGVRSVDKTIPARRT